MRVYVDDGYIKTKLSVDLQVLVDLQDVFKEDAGLVDNPILTHLRVEIVLHSFSPDTGPHVITMS